MLQIKQFVYNLYDVGEKFDIIILEDKTAFLKSTPKTLMYKYFYMVFLRFIF